MEPLERTTTNISTSSCWTFADFIGLLIPLERLVILIKNHRILQRVEILSAEGYKQNRNGVLHRFIILELCRHHEPDAKRTIWLRLDRRMDQSVGKVKFILASGVTPANDTVRLAVALDIFVRMSPELNRSSQVVFSANKEDLIQSARFESRQVFEQTKTLDNLGHLLRVICDELVVYEIWPVDAYA